MFRLIIFTFLFFTNLYGANYQATYSKENIKKDFEKGDTQKYMSDNFPVFSREELISRGVISSTTDLSSDAAEVDCSALLSNSNFTSSIYRFNPKTGKAVCLVAQSENLYNALGVFEVSYPKIAERFKRDTARSESENASSITAANNAFATLRQENSRLSREAETTGNYLSIPQLLTAAVLTDTSIINVQSSIDSGRLVLNNGYNSSVSENGRTTDNTQLLRSDAASLFNIYKGLTNLSFEYVYIIAAFALAFGLGSSFLNETTENENTKKKHRTMWGMGAFMGFLLFFPYSNYQNIQNGDAQGQIDIVRTRFQDFERTGYSIFSEYTSKAAKMALDAELEALIDKASIVNKNQIVDSNANLNQYENLLNYAIGQEQECFNTYDKTNLTNIDKASVCGTEQSKVFPVSELWAYAASWANAGAKDYYNASPAGLVLGGYTPSTISQSQTAQKPQDAFYPKYSMSGCYQVQQDKVEYQNKIDEYRKSYAEAIFTASNSSTTTAAHKQRIISSLSAWQYQMFRDWGYLSILTLPVTKLQTEYLGALYDNKNNYVLKTMHEIHGNNIISENIHKMISSIPYIALVPGTQSVYNFVNENGMVVGAAAGGAAGAEVGGNLFGSVGSWVGGLVGGVAGGATGKFASPLLALGITLSYAFTFVALSPILTILLFGLGRFMIIIIKIFATHFLSVLLLPVVFISKNLEYMKSFAVRVFATMLEIPLFVLSVWMAIVANSLIHSIVDSFSKSTIKGMIQNIDVSGGKEITLANLASMNFTYIEYFKVMILDGIFAIAATGLSIIIIYKLIISLHQDVIDMLQLKGMQSLDAIGDAFSSTKWTGKI